VSYKKNFSNPKQNVSTPKAGLVLALCLLSVFIGVTLAFFFSSDYASKDITMSGAVRIEAVGPAPARNSIEDTVTTTRLVVELDKTFNRLIPGMPISVPANCKVFKSTTKPLLRALLDITMYENDLVTDSADLSIVSNLIGQMSPKIEENGWYLHTDGYFYYVKGIDQDPDDLLGDTILQEVDATIGHTVVDFINFKIDVPEDIDSSYSGKGIKFTITFQAIQNYIPDDEGKKLSNTIENAEKIFSTFNADKYPPTSLDYFNITSTGGELVLDVKADVSLPEVVVLPSEDAEGNAITTLGTTFSGNCGNVKKLIVPSSYTTLQPEAFKNTTLTSVDLSNTTITDIPTNCFSYSNIQSINLPSSLRSISSGAFQNSNLASISIPEGVISIGSTALYSTKIRTLYISSTVESIHSICISSNLLQKIIVHEDNQYFYDINNEMLVGVNGTMYVMAVVNYNEYSLPDDVTHLVNYAMKNANIKVLNINNLRSVGASAFPNYLESFIIPNSNTYFYTSNGIDLIQNSDHRLLYVLLNDNKIDYYIPDDVVIVESNAFLRGKIGTLTIGKNVSTFNHGFRTQYVMMDFFEVHEENEYIRTINNVELISNSNQFIAYSSTCADSLYTIPENITEIKPTAFYNPNLEFVVFPSAITNILWSAFSNCSSLIWMEFKSATPPIIGAPNKFSELTDEFVIYVPDGAVNVYKDVEQLSGYVIKGVSERV